jgi:hypothetical protein
MDWFPAGENTLGSVVTTMLSRALVKLALIVIVVFGAGLLVRMRAGKPMTAASPMGAIVPK